MLKNNITVIEAKPKWSLFDFRELYRFRDLLYFLTLRDIKLRYKQTALGVLWVLLQPLLTMIVFTLFFGKLAKIPSDGIPYAAFTFAALLPWTLFSRALNDSSNSIVANTNLVTKVYFPRILIPLSTIFASLVDFLIAFTLFIPLLFYFKINLTINFIFVPFFILFCALTSFSFSLWLSALNVEYRDVKYTIPFITQFWMFISPVAYPSSLVPDRWKFIYGLNPMAGVIEGFRWSLFGHSSFSFSIIIISFLMVSIIFITGLIYFRKMERTFADVI